MADYTVTLTEQQELHFGRALVYINELRGMETPPLKPLSKPQAIQALCTQRIKEEYEKSKDWERNKLQGALLEATPAQLAQVRQLLGL
jgi:hypothetical protein